MWSAAVLEPGVPGRSRPASASPPATSGRSRKASNGWNPNVFFQVAAAFSFLSVLDRDRGVEVDISHSPGPGRTGGPRRARAAPGPPGPRADAPASIRSSTRHVVGIDATGP